MSADNWGTCPKCLHTENLNQMKMIKKAVDSYGKMELNKWLELNNEANQEIVMQKTLREDYQIGIDYNGEFEVKYSASCEKCGFKFKYDYGKNVPKD
jgi:predicted Zn-ribbon and HTH transcriptional regulator